MNSILEWAKFYIDHGLSVIPLLPKEKKPLVAWMEYRTRLANEKELVEWFADGTANIGIVTGPISKIAVVDFDSQDALKFARRNDFPSCPLVKTSKGYHAYYRYREGVRNFQKRDDLPGIDLRADGGYVVAPPSVHPSGIQYSWVEDRGLDFPMVELPDIILQKRPEHKTPITELYKGSARGSRNNNLARLCGSWVSDGLGFEECIEQAMLWNAKNQPPLDRNEIVQTVESIYDKHHRNDKEEQPEQSMMPIHISEILAKPDEETSMIIEGMLPAGGFSTCIAKPKVGKSTLMRCLALCVARGNDFFGRKTAPGRVIYFSLEEKEQEVKNHFRAMGADSEDNIYLYVGQALKNSMRQIEDAILKIKPVLVIIDPLFKIAKVKDINAGYTQVQDELDKLLWLARKNNTHIIATHHAGKGDKGDVIDSPLGSTAISGSGDAVILLKKTQAGYRTIASTQRYGADLEEVTLSFDLDTGLVSAGPLRKDVEREACEKAITEFLESQNEPVTEQTINEEIEIGKNATKRQALRNLVKTGRVDRTGTGLKGNPFRYVKKVSL